MMLKFVKAKDLQRLLVLEVTSWRTLSEEAPHYYGSLREYTPKGVIEHELRRPVQKKDLRSGYFEGYSLGDTTGRYNSVSEIAEVAASFVRKEMPGCLVDIEGLFEHNRSLRYWKQIFKDIKICGVPSWCVK